MRFEGRELKPYIEGVKAVDLVVGRPYFRIGFIDEDMVIPDLEALVFIGRNLHPEGPGLYFQDAASFLAGERFDPTGIRSLPQVGGEDHGWFTLEMGDAWIDVYPEREAAGVRDFDQALECLMHCALRYREWDGSLRPIGKRADD
jgi:hypothetical protein